MREVPEGEVGPWAPPAYTVDARGKVVGATPGPVHNWGRWGDDDQRGTLNLLTPERVAAAAALARTGRRFSLGLPIGTRAPSGRPDPLHFMRYTTADIVVGDPGWFPGQEISDDYVLLPLQAGTQIDGFAHVAVGQVLYNGFWGGLSTAGGGARRLGIHHLADGVVGRGVLLDVPRHLGVDVLEPGVAVGPDLLDAVCAAQGVTVGPGDVLLLRTGFVGWWYGLAAPGMADLMSGGICPSAVPWLAERDVAMVAADNTAVEVVPWEGDEPLPFHGRAIRDLGLMLGELFDLDELAADCAADGVYEFLFVAMPLPVAYGAGSPLNPVAVK